MPEPRDSDAGDLVKRYVPVLRLVWRRKAPPGGCHVV